MFGRSHWRSRWIAVVGWVGAALFVIWTVFALAAYVGVDAGLAWLDRTVTGDGWITELLEVSGVVDGPTLAVLWMAGAAVIAMLTLMLRRLIDRHA